MRITLTLAALLFASAAIAQGNGMGMDKGKMGGCNMKETPTCGMMTPDEQKAHHDKMMGMKDKGSCTAYMDEHHKQMQARAKDKGMKMPEGKGHGCDKLPAKAG